MLARECFSAWQAASHFSVNNVNPVQQCKAVHLLKNVQSPARVQGIFAYKVCLEKLLQQATWQRFLNYINFFLPLSLFSPLKWPHVFLLLKMLFPNILEIGKKKKIFWSLAKVYQASVFHPNPEKVCSIMSSARFTTVSKQTCNTCNYSDSIIGRVPLKLCVLELCKECTMHFKLRNLV